ncbi:type IV pilus modification PilV family protein [Desulfotruncus alcoholivorax]|uniref:type IV pilus modification PilV family protein n=1 Tax=Desulfotruncus alcoholivorax TaxID=265477 RepID=UPI000483AD66|nr:type II secretion system protein [Desulfotruncus alcoholivorax]
MDNVGLDKKGMTLVEVMVALFIIAICITPVFNSFLLSTRNTGSSEKEIMALELAQGLLEEAVGCNFDQITSVPGNRPFNRIDSRFGYLESINLMQQGLADQLAAGEDTDFSYNLEVGSDPDYPGTMKIIKVNVYYQEKLTGSLKKVVLTGAKARG